MLELLGTCVEIDPDAPPEETTTENTQQKEEDENDPLLGASSRYELVESWTQTLDFSKKRKGAQCDDIILRTEHTQVKKKKLKKNEQKRSIKNCLDNLLFCLSKMSLKA